MTDLDTFNQRTDRLSALVNRIVEGTITGLYIFGPPATGKSESVRAALRRSERWVRPSTGDLSAAALFEHILEHPDAIVWIDDNPALHRDKKLQTYLLHMCHTTVAGAVDNVRMITNEKHRSRRHVEFTGSVIVTSNLPLGDMPILRALETRIEVIHFDPSQKEIIAKIRDLAQHHEIADIHLEQRMEIADYLISRCAALGQKNNLRLWTRAIGHYQAWQRTPDGLHWKDLVDLMITPNDAKPLTREERREEMLAEIRDLIDEASEGGTLRDAPKVFVREAACGLLDIGRSRFYELVKQLDPEYRARYDQLADGREYAWANT